MPINLSDLKIPAGIVSSNKLDTNIDIAGTLDVTSTLTSDSTALVKGNFAVNDTAVPPGGGTYDVRSRMMGVTRIMFDDNVTSSGIDIVPASWNGSSMTSSPFIRFYDNGDVGNRNSTVVNDNSWIIGADDSNVGDFIIDVGSQVQGGALPLTVELRTTNPAFRIDENRFIHGAFAVYEVADSSGTSSIGGTGVPVFITVTPSRGTYLCNGTIQYRGTAVGGDQDQTVIEWRKNGTAVATADIFVQDSAQLSYENANSVTCLISCNGSDTITLVGYTTDPGDPGGADINWDGRIYRIGGSTS